MLRCALYRNARCLTVPPAHGATPMWANRRAAVSSYSKPRRDSLCCCPCKPGRNTHTPVIRHADLCVVLPARCLRHLLVAYTFAVTTGVTYGALTGATDNVGGYMLTYMTPLIRVPCAFMTFLQLLAGCGRLGVCCGVPKHGRRGREEQRVPLLPVTLTSLYSDCLAMFRPGTGGVLLISGGDDSTDLCAEG